MDTSNELILLGGCPASGKSTFAKNKLKNYQIVEFDDWVINKYNDTLLNSTALYHKNIDKNFDLFLQYVSNLRGKIVVCDTWTYKKYRLKAIQKLNIKKIIYLLCDLNVCLERNKNRLLPNELVITYFFLQEIPTVNECKTVEIIRNDIYYQ